MVDNISALIGSGLTSEEEAMASALRGEQRAGDFLGLSTLAPVAGTGRAMSGRATGAAERAGSLRSAAAATRAKKEEADVQRAFERKERIAKIAADKDIATTRADATVEAARLKKSAEKRPKPSAKRVESYDSSLTQLEQLGSLMGILTTMTPEELGDVNQPIKESVIEFSVPQSFDQLAKEGMYNTPKARAFMTKGKDIESQISKIMSGLALTGFEIKARQNWSPFAPGVSLPERIQRMKSIDEKMRSSNERFEFAYGTNYSNPERKIAMPDYDSIISGVTGEAPAMVPPKTEEERLRRIAELKAKAGG